MLEVFWSDSMLKSTESNTVVLHNIMIDDHYVHATKKLVSYQGAVVLHSMICVKFHFHPAAILDTGTEKRLKCIE